MTQDPVPASTFLKLLEYWQISLRFKWMIVGIVASSVLGTGIISKLSPKVYEAKATTMPIKEESLSGGGISFGGGGKDSKGGGGGGGGGGGFIHGRIRREVRSISVGHAVSFSEFSRHGRGHCRENELVRVLRHIIKNRCGIRPAWGSDSQRDVFEDARSNSHDEGLENGC